MQALDQAGQPAQQAKSRLAECEDCGGKVSRKASVCPHCGRPFGYATSQQVTIADLDIKFTSLVGFMVSFAIASIPAAIILMIIMVIFSAIFGGMLFMR